MSLKHFAVVACCVLATPVAAEFAKVNSGEEFKQIVVGKTLSHPLFKLQVSPDGGITGTGMRREVSGDWTWQDGYFCRDLFWGAKKLAYNCQEVRVNGKKIRFTSDKGAGQKADFRIR